MGRAPVPRKTQVDIARKLGQRGLHRQLGTGKNAHFKMQIVKRRFRIGDSVAGALACASMNCKSLDGILRKTGDRDIAAQGRILQRARSGVAPDLT